MLYLENSMPLLEQATYKWPDRELALPRQWKTVFAASVYCIQIITVRWTAHAIMIEHGIFKIFLFLLLFSISCFMDMTNFLAKKWASTIIILNKINAHHQSGKKNQLTTQNQTDCTRSSEIEHWTRTDTILYNSCSTLHLLACFK